MTEKTKTIFRVVKSPNNPFVMMDKRVLATPKLSYKAKGILAYLLSRPDNWTINISDVVNHSSDGEFAVRAGLKELIAAGYVRRKAERNDKQQILRWVMEVFEHPLQLPKVEQESEEPDRGNLHVAFPDVENRDVNNTDSSKTENMGAAAPTRSSSKTPKTEPLEKHLADFPIDCQTGAKLLHEIFNLIPPAKPGPGKKGGEFALWINGLRELNKIAADYDTPLESALRRSWQRWNQNPFSVSHPGALAKTMTSVLASAGQAQSTESAPTMLEQTLGNFKPRE